MVAVGPCPSSHSAAHPSSSSVTPLVSEGTRIQRSHGRHMVRAMSAAVWCGPRIEARCTGMCCTTWWWWWYMCSLAPGVSLRVHLWDARVTGRDHHGMSLALPGAPSSSLRPQRPSPHQPATNQSQHPRRVETSSVQCPLTPPRLLMRRAGQRCLRPCIRYDAAHHAPCDGGRPHRCMSARYLLQHLFLRWVLATSMAWCLIDAEMKCSGVAAWAELDTAI